MVLFLVAAGLTIVVNGAHARGVLAYPGTWTAVAVASAPPAIFAVLALGAHLSHASMSAGMRRIAYVSVGALAAATFAVSYETQRAFVIAETGPLPEWVGWVIPGMLDTLVGVSGIVLYSVSGHGGTVAEKTGPGRWSRIAGAIGDRVENRLAPPVPAPVPEPIPVPPDPLLAVSERVAASDQTLKTPEEVYQLLSAHRASGTVAGAAAVTGMSRNTATKLLELAEQSRNGHPVLSTR